MRVLVLTSYPNETAATRYRITQFIAPLAERGIELDVRPFLDSQLFRDLYRRERLLRKGLSFVRAALRRLSDVWRARSIDVLLVQREAMMFGPPLVEWILTRAARRPMVLDLDDATYVRYTSPTYGRLGSALKWFSKTDDLIRWSRVVTCGNRFIAEYVNGKGVPAVVIPTVVDTELFRPCDSTDASDVPVIGWIGTHSTYQYLESILPVLARLAQNYRFRLKVVGAGREDITVPGVQVDNLPWTLQREVEDFQSLDIGLYPIVADDWAVGKSGFKSIQYMAVGVPFVVTPVGAAGEIGESGVTHLSASSEDEWYEALARLISDASLRARLGAAGRAHAVAHYALGAQAEKLAQALHRATVS
jgi:glycosyltransferase involved in cell wall biosynthesis